MDGDRNGDPIYTEVVKDLGPQLVLIPDEVEPPPGPQTGNDTKKVTKYIKSPLTQSNTKKVEDRTPSLESVESDSEEEVPMVPPYQPNALPEVPEEPPYGTDLGPALTLIDQTSHIAVNRGTSPSLSTNPPNTANRSKSPLTDYLVTSCLMTLKEVANPQKAPLPQLFKVETEYRGKEFTLAKREFILVMYKKPVLVVKGTDNEGKKVYLSQNSRMTMCPIYNEIQQANTMTAKALHTSRNLPPVVKVKEGFTDDKGKQVEVGSLLFFKTETRLKALSRKVRKALVKAKDANGESIFIPANCPGIFSSSPNDLKMYLPELIHRCQFPLCVLLEDGIYSSDIVTLESSFTQDVLVVQRYDPATQKTLPSHLEIPVDCPVAMVKVSLRNKVAEETMYGAVYETLNRTKPPVAGGNDPGLYSTLNGPANEGSEDENDTSDYATVLDWTRKGKTTHSPSTPISTSTTPHLTPPSSPSHPRSRHNYVNIDAHVSTNENTDGNGQWTPEMKADTQPSPTVEESQSSQPSPPLPLHPIHDYVNIDTSFNTNGNTDSIDQRTSEMKVNARSIPSGVESQSKPTLPPSPLTSPHPKHEYVNIDVGQSGGHSSQEMEKCDGSTSESPTRSPSETCQES